METTFADSNKLTPIIFILSPGVDPHSQLTAFAKARGATLHPVSLGQGQTGKALEKVLKGRQQGFWLYLANCHLSISFLKDLEKMIEQAELEKNMVHENYRLFLSSNPHP
jgi:dynein heavy chain, axonemal